MRDPPTCAPRGTPLAFGVDLSPADRLLATASPDGDHS